MSAEYFFTASSLTVGYRGKPLIRDIEIRLRQGQILTLIGPNGSGKSTILRSIARQLQRIGGVVRIGGRSIDDLPGGELARTLSVVLTQRPRTELMTCGEVVAAGRYPHTGMLGVLSARDRALVREAMELVGALDLHERDFNRISDGQHQRVLLARALCQQPQVLVLDEPTSFLDVRHSLELLDILRGMAQQRQITVILSLHELDMAQKVSDLVLCVKGETITHCGPPGEIFRRELIEELYGLPGGSYNPLFGSFELPPPPGEPQVFVIAGGGAGIPQYRTLQQRRIPFATGILHENDVDFQLARDLAGKVCAAPGFQPIGEELYRRALACMTRCGVVIDCLRCHGPLNDKNRELRQQAAALGLRVVEDASQL